MRRATLCLLLLLNSCGADDDFLPGQGSVSSAWRQPLAPSCPEAFEGTALVWLDDPDQMQLEERSLYCLSGTGQLQGSFVQGIEPDHGAAAISETHRFHFDLADPELQQVQVYYAITAMAGYFQPHITKAEALTPLRVELLTESSMTRSRYDLPNRLRIALQGLRPRGMMPTQVLCHEYAHQLILKHEVRIDQVLNEGLADYLAADFTGKAKVLDPERLDLPAQVLADESAMEVARAYLERRVDNQRRYPEGIVNQRHYCDILAQAAAVFPTGSPLVPSDQLTRCQSMSAAELDQVEPHRTGMIVAGLLWDLRTQIGSAVTNRLLFGSLDGPLTYETFCQRLMEADNTLNGGAHRGAIETACQQRGLLALSNS